MLSKDVDDLVVIRMAVTAFAVPSDPVRPSQRQRQYTFQPLILFQIPLD